MESVQNQEVIGRVRLNTLSRILSSFERVPWQVGLHREYTKALIPKIFGDDLGDHIDALLKEFEVTEFRTDVMAVVKRRAGTTEAIAQFSAAYAIAVGGNPQIILSPEPHGATTILDMVRTYLSKIPDVTIVPSINTEIWIKGADGPEDTRKICSFSSPSLMVPWVTPDIIWCDGADKMDTTFFHAVILPATQSTRSVFICNSNGDSAEKTAYSELTELRLLSGERVFNVQKLYACRGCQIAQTEDTCRHCIEGGKPP